MLVTFRTNKDVKYARSFYGQSMPCLSNIGTTYQFLFLGVSCQIKQFTCFVLGLFLVVALDETGKPKPLFLVSNDETNNV